jgi:tetratricopeptide (TPR) repeat protein
MKPSTGILASQKNLIIGALVIVCATLAAYWPVYWAGFIWDDDAYVTNNTLLTAPDGWWRIWFSAHAQSQYFPLVYSTLRLEYDLWQLNPIGYHIVNVCLHIVNALLVWKLLRRFAVPGAWLAAAIFALHPVQVETVAWVTELKNTESTLFYLLALFTWLDFAGGRGRQFYAATILFLLLALFAKTTACTFPAVALLLLWMGDEAIGRRRIVQTLPFFALGLGMGLLSVWWEKHLGNYQPQYHLLGGPVERLLIASHALLFYAGKILLPLNLTFSYPHWNVVVTDWRQYLWLVAFLAVAAGLWLAVQKLGRRPLAAGIFFAAVLGPMLGFVPLYTFYYSFVADHYQYFACLGPITLVVAVFTILLNRNPDFAGLARALSALVIIALATLTWQQCTIYKNLETLWTDTLAKNPGSWMALTNLGRLRADAGDPAAAENFYQRSIAIFPDNADTHYDYANLLARQNNPTNAVIEYEKAIAIAPANADAHNNLGAVLFKLKRPEEAVTQCQTAIASKPDVAHFHYNLGNALLATGQTDAAIAEFQTALRLNPDFNPAKNRLRALNAIAQ